MVCPLLHSYNALPPDPAVGFDFNQFVKNTLTDPLTYVPGLGIAGALGKAGKLAWQLGKHKTAKRWLNQMRKRGWTNAQIDEAIASGQRFPAPNNINKGNTASRYVHPTTGKSVVVDDVTGDIIQVGGDPKAGFRIMQ